MKKGIHEDFNLEYLKKVKKAPKRRLKDWVSTIEWGKKKR